MLIFTDSYFYPPFKKHTLYAWYKVGEMGTLICWARDLIATMVIFIYGSRSVDDCQVGLLVACGGTVNKERS